MREGRRIWRGRLTPSHVRSSHSRLVLSIPCTIKGGMQSQIIVDVRGYRIPLIELVLVVFVVPTRV